MKRNLAIILAFISVASTFASCNSKSNNDDRASDITTKPITTIAVNTEVPSTTVISSSTRPLTSTSSTQTSIVSKTTTSISTTTIETTTTQPEKLTNVQENSIAWLNYLAMLSQEINSSQNSKMYLEEAYAALYTK